MSGSPWGKIQQANQIMRGMRLVETAGHGGIMVTREAAKKFLSQPAIDAGMVWMNYYCYEEDVDVNIVLYELFQKRPDLFSKVFPSLAAKPDVKEMILRSLKEWRSDYLEARENERLVSTDPEAGDEIDKITPSGAKAHFEHGQWWIDCSCGAQYSVVDSSSGLEMERVE